MTTTEISAQPGFDVLAGTIIAAHGVQGAVKLRLATKTALPLISTGIGVGHKPLDVWIGDGPQTDETVGELAIITQVKELLPSSPVYLVKLQSVRERNSAEALIGKSVYAPGSRRMPLESDEFFVEELIGLSVVADTGRGYGKITAVLQQPANDVYETDQGALIPAVKAFVQKIDVAHGKVIVYDVPGLRLDEAEEILTSSQSKGDAQE